MPEADGDPTPPNHAVAGEQIDQLSVSFTRGEYPCEIPNVAATTLLLDYRRDSSQQIGIFFPAPAGRADSERRPRSESAAQIH